MTEFKKGHFSNRLRVSLLVFLLWGPILALTPLLSCVTTRQAIGKISNRFVGKHLDEFVLQHGAPFSKYSLKSGDFLYTWSSGVSTLSMPATTTVYGGGSSATAVTSGGSSIDMECALRIQTSADGVIKMVVVQRDTIGMWSTSMCDESF